MLINNIAAAKPDAVIELGYPGNDIAFLRNLQDSGEKFKFLFAVYPGVEPEELLKAVGIDGLKGVFTYVTGATYGYKVTAGLDLPQYKAAWDKTYANTPGTAFGLNAIAGYTVGMVLQETLKNATSLDQMALHDAVFGLSGKLTTLAGPFKLDDTGRADRRDHAAGPDRAGRQGHEAGGGLSAGAGDREGGDREVSRDEHSRGLYRHARACPGHPRLCCCEEDVDGLDQVRP